MAALAQSEGDFDNFTYINQHNLTEMPSADLYKGSETRPQTELLNLKSSFTEYPDEM